MSAIPISAILTRLGHMSSVFCFQNSASLVIICIQSEWASWYSIIYYKEYFGVSIALYSESVARSISFSISIPKLYSNVGSERLHLLQQGVINNSMLPGIHDLVFWKDSILKSIDGKVSRSNTLSVSENKR